MTTKRPSWPVTVERAKLPRGARGLQSATGPSSTTTTVAPPTGLPSFVTTMPRTTAADMSKPLVSVEAPDWQPTSRPQAAQVSDTSKRDRQDVIK